MKLYTPVNRNIILNLDNTEQIKSIDFGVSLITALIVMFVIASPLLLNQQTVAQEQQQPKFLS